jgi:hypothetical protein
MNEHQIAAGMFCDLHKAFDSVNHQILLKKIQFYGIRGKMEMLIQSYLTDRYERVICDDNFSSWSTVQCGVPQGSILGPLLFLIKINNLPFITNAKNNTMLLYADNTSIVITESSTTAIKHQAFSLLIDINSWFKNNLLLLNVYKTQYLEFRAKNYSISDQTQNSNLHFVTHTKFLGLTIDHTLSWKLHINSLTKKLASVAYAIRSLKYTLLKGTLKIIYFSIKLSLCISYGIIVGGQSSEASKVFIMQKKIFRIIYNLNSSVTCRNVFMQNHIMTFSSYYIYSLILFASNNKELIHIQHHNTRNKNNMHLTNINLTQVKKGPYFSCICMFNHLPNNIKSLDFNIKKHKEIFKNFIRLMNI